MHLLGGQVAQSVIGEYRCGGSLVEYPHTCGVWSISHTRGVSPSREALRGVSAHSWILTVIDQGSTAGAPLPRFSRLSYGTAGFSTA
jgi:hypothetical protein